MSGRWNRCGGAIPTMRAYLNLPLRGNDNDRRELQAAALGRRDTYLALAAELKPLLAQIDGFISIEPPGRRSCAPAVALLLARRGGGAAVAQSRAAPGGAGARPWRGAGAVSAAGGGSGAGLRAGETRTGAAG